MKLKPMRFAHRGLVQYAPENTIPAFAAAVEHGCEGIELDVHLSKDGIPVVTHDVMLTRLSDGKVERPVGELTAAEIKAIDIPYAGQLLPHDPPVPYSEQEGSVHTYTQQERELLRKSDKRVTHISTLEEVDKWFEAVSEDVTIEIEFCELGLTEPVFEVLKKSKNCGRYIVFSGDEDRNAEIQGYIRKNGKPEGLRLGANLRRLTEEKRAFIEQADLYEVGLNDFWFTEDDVKWLSERNIKVFSNLGDYPEWWEKINEYKIEAFKTNYAEAYAEWLSASVEK